MRKRIISMMLCCVMLLGLLPVMASADIPGTMITTKTNGNFFYLSSKPSADEAGDNYYLFLFEIGGNPALAGRTLVYPEGTGSYGNTYKRNSNEGRRGDCILTSNDGLRFEPITDRNGQTYYYIKNCDNKYYKRKGDIFKWKHLDYTPERKDATLWSIDEENGAYIIKEKGEKRYWNYDTNRKILSISEHKDRAIKFKIYKRENPTYVLSFNVGYGKVIKNQYISNKEFSSLVDPKSDNHIYGVHDPEHPIKITLPCDAMLGFQIYNILFFHYRVEINNEPISGKRDPGKYLSLDPDIVTIVANSKEGVSEIIEQKEIKVEVYYDSHKTKSGISIGGNKEPLDTDYTVTDPGSCISLGTRVLVCKNCGLEILKDSNGYGDHNWNTPTYTWNEDHSECTAMRTCKNNSYHKETASATASRTETPPTCTSDGKIEYTAVFDKPWAKTQTYSEKKGDKTNHTYGDWNSDGENTHSRFCTAPNCESQETEPHTYDGDTDDTCEICGYKQSSEPVDPPAHEHTYGKWSSDGETTHSRSCTVENCPDKNKGKVTAAHDFGENDTCNDCGYERTINPPSHEHKYSDWSSDDKNHWHECTDETCPDKNKGKVTAAHDFGENDTCNDCGYKRTINPPSHKHTYGKWRSDGETGHSRFCTDRNCPDDDRGIENAEHVFGSDDICELCAYQKDNHGDDDDHDDDDDDDDHDHDDDDNHDHGRERYLPMLVYYDLSFDTNGGSRISDESFLYGVKVDLSEYIPTRSGYTFTGWYSDIELTDPIASVRMSGNKTVYAGWHEEIDEDIIDEWDQETDDELHDELQSQDAEDSLADWHELTEIISFDDVSEYDWFRDDVMFVYGKEMMLGTSDITFNPYGMATRSMIATILWRMEGSPSPMNVPDFADVDRDVWYSDAVAWATENGIYQGYGNGRFGPNDPVTREQLAAIFCRYANYKRYDVIADGSLDQFDDGDTVSDWAQEALKWAIGSGLINGKPDATLDPQGTANRAEIAAILHRFIEKYVIA